MNREATTEGYSPTGITPISTVFSCFFIFFSFFHSHECDGVISH